MVWDGVTEPKEGVQVLAAIHEHRCHVQLEWFIEAGGLPSYIEYLNYLKCYLMRQVRIQLSRLT
jgi:hypothetical protein